MMAAGESLPELPAVPSTSRPSTGPDAPSKRSSNESLTESRSVRIMTEEASASRIDDVWKSWEQRGDIRNGSLAASRLTEFLSEMQLDAAECASAMAQISEHGSSNLTYTQLVTLCGYMEPPSPCTSSGTGSQSQVSLIPLKKCLSKSKQYMGTGYMVYDDTVITYIRKLEEHRKKCEADGRYKEAKAAASRLVDLKTAQVSRMRQELLLMQTQELTEVHRVYEEETRKFNAVWEARIREYQATFMRAVEDLKAQQQQQSYQLSEQLSLKRPTKPKPSRDYLNSKKIEASLAKVKEYKRASQVKSATDEMYQAELEQAVQAFEVEQRLKLAKMGGKQQQEVEALLQRGSRGKSELELRRAAETERRMYRFRNIVMELENLHKLEVVSLENFLDGQVQAGKAVPIKDSFQRKREQLFNTPF